MTTINGVNLGLSGATGTVHFVGSTSPTLVTPTLGAATATSITFSPTTSGIVGTTTNDNAAAGKVGEFVSSVISSGSPVSLSDSTPANITSISLTAGDWDVNGNVYFVPTGNSTGSLVWTSATSATEPDSSLVNEQSVNSATVGNIGISAPYMRFSLSTTTTIYLSCISVFSTGAMGAYGGIYARRAR